MGMSQDLIDGLSDAFDNDLSDAVTAFVYTAPNTGAIVPATGIRATVTPNGAGRGIANEIDQKAQSLGTGQIGDIEMTYLTSELLDSAGSPVAPVVGGIVTFSGTDHTIISQPTADPSQTVGTLMIRG